MISQLLAGQLTYITECYVLARLILTNVIGENRRVNIIAHSCSHTQVTVYISRDFKLLVQQSLFCETLSLSFLLLNSETPYKCQSSGWERGPGQSGSSSHYAATTILGRWAPRCCGRNYRKNHFHSEKLPVLQVSLNLQFSSILSGGLFCNT